MVTTFSASMLYIQVALAVSPSQTGYILPACSGFVCRLHPDGRAWRTTKATALWWHSDQMLETTLTSSCQSSFKKSKMFTQSLKSMLTTQRNISYYVISFLQPLCKAKAMAKGLNENWLINSELRLQAQISLHLNNLMHDSCYTKLPVNLILHVLVKRPNNTQIYSLGKEREI